MIELEKVDGLGPRNKMLLEKLSINNVEELVTHYQYRYDFIRRSDLKNAL